MESLIGPDTIDTVPPATFEAFRAHGSVRPTLQENLLEAHTVLDSLPSRGVDLAAVTDQLLADGLDKFAGAFRALLSSVEHTLAGPATAQPWRLRRSLPRDLTAQVDAAVDGWRATDKVLRIWTRDPAVWTGHGLGCRQNLQRGFAGDVAGRPQHREQAGPCGRRVSDHRGSRGGLQPGKLGAAAQHIAEHRRGERGGGDVALAGVIAAQQVHLRPTAGPGQGDVGAVPERRARGR